MDIAINIADGVPIYRQIVNQIRYMIGTGLLEPDEELPPIRTLALQIKVTPNTVVKAYAQLEAAGLVHKRRGAGTFVSGQPSPLATKVLHGAGGSEARYADRFRMSSAVKRATTSPIRGDHAPRRVPC